VVWIIPSVFAPVDRYNVCAGMLATLDLGNDNSPKNVLPTTDIVMLIAATWAVISSFDAGHLSSPEFEAACSKASFLPAIAF
jgi:hypothetical protein